MKLLEIIFILLFLSFKGIAQNDIYSFKIDSIENGKIIDFSSFKGKEILIVNIATNDTSFVQYSELKELQKFYKERLVVVAIPCTDFSSEPGNKELSSFFFQKNTQFPVTAKTSVLGNDMHDLFKWITKKKLNGVMDSEIKKPFQKYLISKEGKLIGVFSKSLSPMNVEVRKAIDNSLSH